MKLGLVLAILFAGTVHGGVILFGRLLFLDTDEDHGTLQQVELLSEEQTKPAEEKKPEEAATEESEEMETDAEQPPDAAEMMRDLELSDSDRVPELEAASLGAIESALRGESLGGGDFGQSLDFASGGRIGGTGKAGDLEEKLDGAFSISEIDQKPRAVFQAAPLYPADLRGKKLEGVVTLVFVVDPAGKVLRPKVESSTHASFEKPALDAVKQWKFEPAVKSGQRVPCKMRVPIRFQPS